MDKKIRIRMTEEALKYLVDVAHNESLMFSQCCLYKAMEENGTEDLFYCKGNLDIDDTIGLMTMYAHMRYGGDEEKFYNDPQYRRERMSVSDQAKAMCQLIEDLILMRSRFLLEHLKEERKEDNDVKS